MGGALQSMPRQGVGGTNYVRHALQWVQLYERLMHELLIP